VQMCISRLFYYRRDARCGQYFRSGWFIAHINLWGI
jgi:hypothetical protein